MKIVLEEIISQEFEVPDGTDFEEIERMYRDSELVLDNASLTQLNVQIAEDEGFITLI